MHMQPASFALALLSFACALGWASVYCYSASFVTERILSNGNTMWSTNWFDYPPELRKYVLLITLVNSKKSPKKRGVFFKVFGVAESESGIGFALGPLVSKIWLIPASMGFL